jgi:hypothetical protein
MPTLNVQRLAGTDLAAALSAHTFPGAIPSVAAEWRRVPDYTADDLGALKVSVTPGTMEINQRDQPTREMDFFYPSLGIVIAKSVATDAEVDDLDELVQHIVDAIRSYHVGLESFDNSTDWLEIAVPVPFDREMLNERKVFLAEINVVWMVGIEKVAAPTPTP